MIIQTNIPQLSDAIAQFIHLQRMDVREGWRFQARLLAERVVAFTPPKNKTQGRAAVKRDIHRAVSPLNANQFKSAEIRRLIRKRDYHALNIIFGKMRSRDLVVRFSPELHERARDRRGRVQRDQHQVTPDADKVREYITRIQEHVGQGKGGWAASVLALGGKVAGWIAGHATSGEFVDALDQPEGYISMLNKSRWASRGDDDRVVAEAIRSRTQNIRDYLALKQAQALKKAKLK